MVSLVALVGQLGAVAALAGVSYGLNKLRPPHVRYRPLKLSAWIPSLIFGWLLINFLVQAQIPARFFPTPQETRVALQAARSVCTNHTSTFEEIKTAMYNRPKPSAEFLQAQRSPIDQIEPVINQVLFSLGVAFVSIPVWIRLLFLGLRRLLKIGSAATDSALAPLRAEWGILLPLVNVTTTLTVFTSPFYFFYLAPNRTADCVYTSGHWYTTGCTLLGFCIVVSHILSYLYGDDILGRRSHGESSEVARAHMKSILGGLLQSYAITICVYLLLVSLVLRVTQQMHHDDFEASAGLKRSTESFLLAMCLVIVVQYVTFAITTKSQSKTQLLVPSAPAASSTTPSNLKPVASSPPPPPSSPSPSSPSSPSPSASSSSQSSQHAPQAETQAENHDDLDQQLAEVQDLLTEIEASVPEPEEAAPLPPNEEAPLPPPPPPSAAAPPPPPPPPSGSVSLPPPPPPPAAASSRATDTRPRRSLDEELKRKQSTLRQTVKDTRAKPQDQGLAGTLSASLSKLRLVMQPDEVDDDDDSSWDDDE